MSARPLQSDNQAQSTKQSARDGQISRLRELLVLGAVGLGLVGMTFGVVATLGASREVLALVVEEAYTSSIDLLPSQAGR